MKPTEMFGRLIAGVVVHEGERQRRRWGQSHAEHQLRHDEERHGSAVEFRGRTSSSTADFRGRRLVHAITHVQPPSNQIKSTSLQKKRTIEHIYISTDNVINECRQYFDSNLLSEILVRKSDKMKKTFSCLKNFCTDILIFVYSLIFR